MLRVVYLIYHKHEAFMYTPMLRVVYLIDHKHEALTYTPMLRVVYLIDHKQGMEVRFHAAKKIGLISINIGVQGGWPVYAELPDSVGVSKVN